MLNISGLKQDRIETGLKHLRVLISRARDLIRFCKIKYSPKKKSSADFVSCVLGPGKGIHVVALSPVNDADADARLVYHQKKSPMGPDIKCPHRPRNGRVGATRWPRGVYAVGIRQAWAGLGG